MFDGVDGAVVSAAVGAGAEDGAGVLVPVLQPARSSAARSLRLTTMAATTAALTMWTLTTIQVQPNTLCHMEAEVTTE